MPEQNTKNSVPADVADQRSALVKYAKFIIPSLIGIGLFLTPITYDGKQTIVIGLLSSSLQEYLGYVLSLFIALT
ncbi:MAG: nucleoside recognition membrane protein YjiH, partial [Arenicella sp.]